VATELSALVDAGTIRVIDALTLTKDDDGTTAGVLIWET
jgi:hypothetical protein